MENSYGLLSATIPTRFDGKPLTELNGVGTIRADRLKRQEIFTVNALIIDLIRASIRRICEIDRLNQLLGINNGTAEAEGIILQIRAEQEIDEIQSYRPMFNRQ